MIEENLTYEDTAPLDRVVRFCYTEGCAIKRFGEAKMTTNNYRKKPIVVNAFQWRGRDTLLPPWVNDISRRNADINEATDPPGLVVNTIKHGAVRIEYNGWFVHEPVENRARSYTNEEFKREFEPNA